MKLQGIRVLDLSLFLPGPYLTTLMADHGAEVIKLEPPTGEPARRIGQRAGDHSVWFRNIGRGKKSIVLDLKQPAELAALNDLAKTCDVMLEAFRPGVADRLGIGAAAMTALNPRLVYCSISAFGQDGPDARRPAHDLAVEALAGTISVNLGQDGRPTHPNVPVADVTASLLALSGILMALLRRESTGRGDVIDMAMFDATLSWLPNATGAVFGEGRAPVVKHERQWGGGAFYNIYPTSDDRWVVLGGAEHKFVETLLHALGRPDLIAGASGPPGPGHDAARDFLRATFATRTRDEWEAWFEGRDVCFAPVLDLHEAFQRPHVAARQMLVRDAEGHLHIGLPIKFRDEPGTLNPAVPELGEHTASVLAEARRLLAR
ncbi:CaiB/BaiF CoA transferase family protein [Falsiroseomonas selenitidurans]|uniref:CoA transferase n=1 Tax=Falsiroseomonas selenitidurans TaxID=2716335 RepID=A0ABX1DXL0_9PROT|nr:CoA transferase [Falsiroseomonas selenitidurans]NKC29604.1 CoA transferase [Falsiroseomonas selenitidurans]